MQVPKKEILNELKQLADTLGISLKDLLFTHNSDIIFLKDEADIKKSVSDKIVTKGHIEKDSGYFVSEIIVPDGYTSDIPVQLCFFLEKEHVVQKIKANITVGDNANVRFFASCFTTHSQGTHIDDKTITIGNNSSYELYEFHYNAEQSYLTTATRADVNVGVGSSFVNEFLARHGNIGNFTKHIQVDAQADAKVFLSSKMDLHPQDKLHSYNTINLNEPKSSAMIISKTVTRSESDNFFQGRIYGRGDHTKGHIDCEEILLGDGNITTRPELNVINPTSRLTHESAVGRIEKGSIDNLMIKGLTPEQAQQCIIQGCLA